MRVCAQRAVLERQRDAAVALCAPKPIFGQLLAAETKRLLGRTGSGELEGDGKLQSLAIVVARRQRLCGTAPEAADMKVNEGV